MVYALLADEELSAVYIHKKTSFHHRIIVEADRMMILYP